MALHSWKVNLIERAGYLGSQMALHSNWGMLKGACSQRAWYFLWGIERASDLDLLKKTVLQKPRGTDWERQKGYWKGCSKDNLRAPCLLMGT